MNGVFKGDHPVVPLVVEGRADLPVVENGRLPVGKRESKSRTMLDSNAVDRHVEAVGGRYLSQRDAELEPRQLVVYRWNFDQ